MRARTSITHPGRTWSRTCLAALEHQGFTSIFLCKVIQAHVGWQGLGLAEQTCALGLRWLRAAAMGALAGWALPSCLPCTLHKLGQVAYQAGSTGAQAEQGSYGEGCSNGNTQDRQLHTGIQQTCTSSADPSAPFHGAIAPCPPLNSYLCAGGRQW